MTTTIATTVRIFGEFDPDELSRALSLPPTRTWRKGDTRAGAPLLHYDEDGWSLTVGPRATLHLDEELAELLTVLRPHARQLRDELAARHLTGQVCFAVDV